jgi:hypothetical protein
VVGGGGGGGGRGQLNTKLMGELLVAAGAEISAAKRWAKSRHIKSPDLAAAWAMRGVPKSSCFSRGCNRPCRAACDHMNKHCTQCTTSSAPCTTHHVDSSACFFVLCDLHLLLSALRNPFASGVGYTRLGCPLRSVESSTQLLLVLRPDCET